MKFVTVEVTKGSGIWPKIAGNRRRRRGKQLPRINLRY